MEIKDKIEEELKPYETMCEETTEHLKSMICGSCEAAPEEILCVAKTLGEITDIKKDIVEMCYKKQILEAMETADYGEDYDEYGAIAKRGYRGQPRDRMGRFSRTRGYQPYDMPYDMPRYDNDMRWVDDLVYFTNSKPNMGGMEGNMRGSMPMQNPSPYENAKRGYEQSKATGNTTESMQKLDELMTIIDTDIIDKYIPAMTSSEKSVVKTKIQNWMNKM